MEGKRKEGRGRKGQEKGREEKKWGRDEGEGRPQSPSSATPVIIS